MLKKFMYISAFLCTIFSAFFIVKIAEKTYFNEAYYKVPDIRGIKFDDATKELENENLKVKLVGEEYSRYPRGEIFMQEPEPNQVVKIKRSIRVWVSKGAALVEVPNLEGMNFLEAKSIAEQKGLIIDRVVSIKTNKPTNEVISTDPATDTLLSRGDKISFLISGTSQFTEVKVPELMGLDLDSAKEEIEKISLKVGKIKYKDNKDQYNGIILESSLVAGVRVRVGTTIDLVVNRSKLEKPLENSGGSNNGDDVDAGDVDVEDMINAADVQGQ
ncbi:PASTA domain-containing protein [Fusobacterium sp. PH5-44]|uniref:PASTA domain-containing protein n=1 Tax=unclassified Fusobacterium TaxID=2648384 RepID=UPI003D1D3BAF